MDSRRRLIRELVVDVGVSSQAELQTLLSERGFEVTQATISRDLTALGVHKSGNGSSARYILGIPNQSNIEIDGALNGFGVSIQASGNIVVIRTQPSAAAVVAGAIDRAGLNSVLGTVAGDDTVLIVTADPDGGTALANALDPSTRS